VLCRTRLSCDGDGDELETDKSGRVLVLSGSAGLECRQPFVLSRQELTSAWRCWERGWANRVHTILQCTFRTHSFYSSSSSSSSSPLFFIVKVHRIVLAAKPLRHVAKINACAPAWSDCLRLVTFTAPTARGQPLSCELPLLPGSVCCGDGDRR
jgi:hypothetical protein